MRRDAVMWTRWGVVTSVLLLLIPGRATAEDEAEQKAKSRLDLNSRFARVISLPKRPRAVTKAKSEGDTGRPTLAEYPSEVAPAVVSESVELASPWWLDETRTTTRPEVQQLPVSLESLLVRAVDHSSQIKVFSDLPLIRETAITEADAAFDWYAFMDSRWNDTNEPVGSLLTGVPLSGRYKNDQLSNSAGLRRRTLIGGKLEAAQQSGFQDTNSVYFNPSPQGTARLTLSYTQPLLRGAGRLYNKSLICLAEIDTEIAENEFSRQLQSHLLEVTRAFWTLHIERTNVALKRRSLERAEDVARLLKDRAAIDAVLPQLQRATAEIATRQSQLVRAKASVRNAEARLRSLVNDPELGGYDTVELIPLDRPTQDRIPIDRSDAMSLALMYRPEVAQALDQVKAGAIRLRMSKQELLPILNVVMQTYVAGLHGDGSIGDAWTSQFSTGSPSYSVGAQFEAPLGNRAAQARMDRRFLECRQLRSQYEVTLKSLALEVGVAVREVRASYSEMLAQSKSVQASTAQLENIQQRWKLLPGEDGNGALVLENMLQAQARLAKSEAAYVNAWITYNMALINLKRATGELLQQEHVTWCEYRDECEGIKTRVVSKPDLGLNASTSPPSQASGPTPLDSELSPILPVPPAE